MALNITVIGNGQVAELSSAVSIAYPDSSSWLEWAIGTGYQLSAIPDPGWAFSKWEAEYWRRHEDRNQDGTWTQTWDVDENYSSLQNPHGPPRWDFSHTDPYVLGSGPFEGRTFQRYNTTTWQQQRWTCHDWSISCYFRQTHIPTHLIIRDDATGTILRGGTQNKILRDD
jgi:hypothetical protein